MLDLDAYLARIGLRGRPDMAELHRAHVTSIPFENLDPHRGMPVSLAPEDLERKLVHERRGGYCFEQNLLLKAGARGARRRGRPVAGPRPRRAPRRARSGPAPTSSCACRPRAAQLARRRGLRPRARCSSRSRSARADVHEQSGWRFRVVAGRPRARAPDRPRTANGSICTASFPSRSRSSTSRPATGSPPRIRARRSSPD